jgi:hypothetical protein
MSDIHLSLIIPLLVSLNDLNAMVLKKVEIKIW